MQAPRSVFVLALSAAVFAGLGALALPRVAQALPSAQAAVPAAREALQQRAPEAARALGLTQPSAEAPVVDGEPVPVAPSGVEAAGFATQQLGGFTVPHFAAMAADEDRGRAAGWPEVELPSWSSAGR